jgi:manganese/zinc/iron transport system permease protein
VSPEARAAAETAAVLAALGAACAVPGTLLVARRLVMVADAIGHVLLLGVVVAFFLVPDPGSPWLLAGAAVAGFATVALVELLRRTKLLAADAAVGLAFPALFALGTALASAYLRNTHLDVDQVLLGSAEFAPLDRWSFSGLSLPRSLAILISCCAVWLAVAGLAFKELQLAAFDPAYAALAGFLPGLLHALTMAGVSLTAVAGFDAAGPVLMLAFFAVPPLIARRFTDRFARVAILAAVVGAAAGAAGSYLALYWNTTVAGTAAGLLGVVWCCAELFAPRRGAVADWWRRRQLQETLADHVLLVHLARHAGTAAEADENRADGLHRHLLWPERRIRAVVARCAERGLVAHGSSGVLVLTDAGRFTAAAIPA